MIFTGKNLILVRRAVDLAIAEIQGQIGVVPDVHQYAEDLIALEAEQAELQGLLDRIDSVLGASKCLT